MGRKRKTEAAEEAAVEIVEGTVEHAAREHFEREKAAYEERTGEKCNYYMPHPLTSTPLPDPSTTPSAEAADTPPNQGGEPDQDEEGEAQGDE